MPSETFTAGWLDRVKPPTTGRVDYFDTKLTGLGLRVSATGKKSWFLFYRKKGEASSSRLTIGRYPQMTLADAREKGAEVMLTVTRGADPSAEREIDKKAPTFADLAAEYLEQYAKAPRKDGRPTKLTWKEDERKIKTDLKPWADLKAKDITRRDVVKLLDGIKARAPVGANRVLALISKIYNVGIDRGIVESNPTARMNRVTEEVPRERVLTQDEIRALWAAFGDLAKRADGRGITREGHRLAVMFKVRLLTAQRGGEVSLMAWEDIDLDRRTWTIPRPYTKTKSNAHEVPLSQQVVDLITSLSEEHKGWVFPSARAKGKPIVNIRKAAERVVEATGIDFNPHDLRRTAATFVTEMGIPRLVVSKILNHAEGGVTWKYDRHEYEAEKRDALDRWGKRVDEILKNKSGKIRQLALQADAGEGRKTARTRR